MNIKRLILSGMYFLCFISLQAQITVQGIVRDAETTEVLIDATIEDSLSQTWTFTDEKGRFIMKIPEESSIFVSFLGYTPSYHKIDRDTFLNIYLSPSVFLDDVVVSESARKSNPSVSTMKALDIVNIPSLGGKADIIKGLQTLPGIQGTHEASATHVVRGGSPGENAYFIDGAPLIYVNHLAGFLSVFNTDMINSIDIYKGGFPANHGGKLSSIIDIHQNSGNKKEIEGELSLGVTDLSGSIQGPIIKDKLSFIVTARKTLFDYLLLFASRHLNDGSEFFYGFHDINGKLSYIINDKNIVNFNMYQGDDYINIHNSEDADLFKSTNTWGNVLVSANWESFVSSSLVANTVASYTKYRIKDRMFLEPEEGTFNRLYSSSLALFYLKSDWNKTFSSDLNLRFGIESRLNRSVPTRTVYNGQFTLNPETKNYGTLVSYIEPEYKPDNHFIIYPGLRASYYNFLKDGRIYLDPRLRINYEIDKHQHISSSFMRVHQFEHLFSTIGGLSTNEVWVPSETTIPVATSDQLSIGYTNSNFKGFYLKTAIYYKWMSKLTDYKEGYSLILGDPDYKNKILSGGTGKSYGLEILLRKEKGDWRGSLSYAYSRSFRQFEDINKGNRYPYDFDRPHSFNITIYRQLSKSWEVSAAWYFQSGLPYTPTIGKQYIPDVPGRNGSQKFYEALIYGEKNSGRIKNYHRLDISASHSSFYPSGKLRRKLTFGFYNAYYNKNPYYYFYNDKAGDLFNLETYYPKSEGFKPLKEIGVNFFPIIPYISYKWYLK